MTTSTTPLTRGQTDHAVIELTVSARATIADGVVLLSLQHAHGRALPDWQPGAHLEITLPSGLVRNYSLSGDPANRRTYHIAVLDEFNGRGGSREIHISISAGTTLRARGPRNRFALVDSGQYLFIAGGIGITPIIPMIREVHGRGADWRLVYGGRTLTSMAFLDALAQYPAERVTIVPEDTDGRPDLTTAIASSPPDADVYVCGPSGLLDAVSGICAQQRPARTVHMERFSADTSDAEETSDDTPIEVELRRSGHVLKVSPGQTILSAIQEAIPDMPYSCEEGICGSCETVILEGIPLHRDSVLSPEEAASNRTMMVCVGWAHSARIVLDL